METGLNAFKEALHLKHVEAGEYSPLALAYIGDVSMSWRSAPLS